MIMLSRVAASTYWMARYLERAEDTARLVNVNSNLLLDLPGKVQLGWEPLLDIMNRRKDFSKSYGESSEKNVIKYLVSDLNNMSSILSSISIARENLRTIRDIMPRDTWEVVNRLYQKANDFSSHAASRTKRYDYLMGIIFDIQGITGNLSGTMTHDEAYQFLRIGRNLERADMTSRILDVQSASLLTDLPENMIPFQNIQWVSVLKSMSAYQMYRKGMRIGVRRPEVIRFLLQEELFPRSFIHCLKEINECMTILPKNDKISKYLSSYISNVKKGKPDKLNQEELHDFIDSLQRGLIWLNEQIHEAYF